jgi:type I restriction-modification system DNA methylase subunit/restriction endonuclease S subunit
VLKKKKTELVLQKPDGKRVWESKTDNELKEEDNTELEELQTVFNALIKQCHQTLYNNGAIVGKKAMDDIMKILTLKLLQPLFNEGMVLHTEYIKELGKEENKIETEDIELAYQSCIELKHIYTDDDTFDKWRELVRLILEPIMSNLYNEDDYKFNGNELAIKIIMRTIDKCNVFNELMTEKNGKKYYDSVSGKLYEYFMNKYVSGGGKDLGQFFTPRYMIDMMVYGLKITEHINIDENTSIYDPCTGSGGFLTRLYNCFPELNPNNIYGSEVEKDTMKFCISNLLLTTSTFCENIVNDNSVVYEDDKKHDIILTNPPFGTSMKYGKHKVSEGGKQVFKDGLEQVYNLKYPSAERKAEFKTIYPIKTNDGACLFTQKCVYKLKENGLLSIVLPDGQLFFGKNFRKFRKWLSEQMNIRYIVQAPSGTFEHAGIKTCVIMATKDGPTEKIQFMKTDKECSYLEKIVDIDSDDLRLGEYSLDPKDYLEDEYLSRIMEESCVEWKIMKDICDIKNGIPGFYQITKYYDNSGTIKLIRGINLREEETNYQYLNNDAKDIIAKNLMKTDDILYADASHKNLCKIVPNEWNGLSHVGCLRLTNFNDVNYKYIYNFIKSEIFDTIRKKYERGATISHFPRHIFENIKIPLPALPIQQKIVTELDQLEEHTKTLKQLLEHTKKAKEMYERYGMIKEIRELLNGCEWKKLGEVCNLEYGTRITKSKSGKKDGKYPVYGGGDISYYTDKYNRNGETCKIGRFGISMHNLIMFMNCEYYLNDGGMTLVSKNISLLLNKYVWYNMYFRKVYLYTMLSGGSAQAGTNIDRMLSNVKIPVPSIPVQQKCIEVYQQKETVLKDYDKKIEDYENDIKHNQELGRQVIEYYITADFQPDIKESDTENVNELSDSNDTDMKTISSNKSKSQKKKKKKKKKQKEHSIESYDEEPEIRVVSKKRKKKVVRRTP